MVALVIETGSGCCVELVDGDNGSRHSGVEPAAGGARCGRRDREGASRSGRHWGTKRLQSVAHGSPSLVRGGDEQDRRSPDRGRCTRKGLWGSKLFGNDWGRKRSLKVLVHGGENPVGGRYGQDTESCVRVSRRRASSKLTYHCRESPATY